METRRIEGELKHEIIRSVRTDLRTDVVKESIETLRERLAMLEDALVKTTDECEDLRENLEYLEKKYGGDGDVDIDNLIAELVDSVPADENPLVTIEELQHYLALGSFSQEARDREADLKSRMMRVNTWRQVFGILTLPLGAYDIGRVLKLAGFPEHRRVQPLTPMFIKCVKFVILNMTKCLIAFLATNTGGYHVLEHARAPNELKNFVIHWSDNLRNMCSNYKALKHNRFWGGAIAYLLSLRVSDECLFQMSGVIQKIYYTQMKFHTISDYGIIDRDLIERGYTSEKLLHMFRYSPEEFKNIRRASSIPPPILHFRGRPPPPIEALELK